jgi:hypothetical protein
VGTGRELLWFYVRPTLHAALAERAARRGRDMEVEIIDILEAATKGPSKLGRRHLRLIGADEVEHSDKCPEHKASTAVPPAALGLETRPDVNEKVPGEA